MILRGRHMATATVKRVNNLRLADYCNRLVYHRGSKDQRGLVGHAETRIPAYAGIHRPDFALQAGNQFGKN